MKKSNVIAGNLSESNLVQKSRPLLLMKNSFGLGELKVLDVYLSRINSHNSDRCTVRFTKEEYEDLMQIERMRPERLSKYVDSLMGKTVTVPDPDCSGAWKKYVLFTYSECFKENDVWYIDLSCSEKAFDLFFNIDSIGYIRYQLSNVIKLTSKYSVLLYLYLRDNAFRGKFTVSLTDLREGVFCCTSDYYLTFKRFNSQVFKKSLDEVNKLTDLTFEYKTVKRGRNVFAIEFTLVKDDCVSVNDNVSSLPVPRTSSLADMSRELLDNLLSVCDNEFSDHQVELLYKHISSFVAEPARVSYLENKYEFLVYRASKKKISNRFGYIRKLIDSDYKEYLSSLSDSKSDNDGYAATYDLEEYANSSFLDELE